MGKAKQAAQTEIDKYREKLLTNPVTFATRLDAVREDLRQRSEVLFIDRDLTEHDVSIDDDVRQTETDRIDEMILRVGKRIDDLDAQIAAHKKAHPDLDLQRKIAEAAGTSVSLAAGAKPNRQMRRDAERLHRQQEKRLAGKQPEHDQPEHNHPPQTMTAPEAPPSAEEAPTAEGAAEE